jgi:hypothetical protein
MIVFEVIGPRLSENPDPNLFVIRNKKILIALLCVGQKKMRASVGETKATRVIMWLVGRPKVAEDEGRSIFFS